MLMPYDNPWKLVEESLGKFTGDLLANGREQPQGANVRESFDD